MRPPGKEETKLADRAFRLSIAQLEPLRRNSQTEQLHVRPFDKACIKCGEAIGTLLSAVHHMSAFLSLCKLFYVLESLAVVFALRETFL